MKIASWNVNSLRVRLPHLLRFLTEASPDVVALQELKQPDSDFPIADIEAAGYCAVWSGQKTYNGVALLARNACEDVGMGFPDYADDHKRLLAATINGVRVVNIYVPNGQSVGSDKYEYKLEWLNHLHNYLQQVLQQYEKVLVVGDFNIAPEDRDIHDPITWQGHVLCSAPERAALEKIFALGLVDSFRLFPQAPQSYSWWDYRTFAFQGNRGWRIDLMLANPALANTITRAWIEIGPRAWERPSDHAPVMCEIKA
jgi:exodeoxyribonuclease III